MEIVKVKIDGEEVEVSKDTTILEAAKKLNKLIPTFCYHEKLPIFGGCRICLVYDVKLKRSVIACGTYVYDGMEIETQNEQIRKDREFILQMLFSRHPLDCPICDKAGECDLQNWGTYWGPQKNLLPISPFEKIRDEEDWESDYLEYVSNRCILCMKCVSVCDNVNKSHSLFQLERAFETLISPVTKPMDISSCEMCGLCVDICPVGAILFKPFKFNVRPWLLKESYTHCGFCSLNCPVVVNHDGKTIYRIRSTAELESCPKVYLGYDSFNTNRLKNITYKGKTISNEEALNIIGDLFNDKTAIFISPYLSSELIELLFNIYSKTDAYFTSEVSISLQPLLEGYGKSYMINDLSELKNFKNIYLIGDDITDTNPVLSYYLPEGVVYIGDKLDRLKKLKPQVIELSGKDIIDYIHNVEEGSAIVYSSYFYARDAFELGRVFRHVEENKNCKLFIIPPYTNGFGLINIFGAMDYLPDVIDKIQKKDIENIILFGEEFVELVEEDTFRQLWNKLRFKAIFTPFEDGLALISDICIPLNSWAQEDGTFYGSRGIRKFKKTIDTNFSTYEFLKKLSENIYQKDISRDRRETDYRLPDYINLKHSKIYDITYYTNRSKNLLNWKEKLIGEMIDGY